MVLVRKTELACRNSWDQDLWNMADWPVDMQPSTHIPMPVSEGDLHDIPVMRAELPADSADRAGEMFTDRITSISMPTRSQLRPGRSEMAEAAQAVDDAASAELHGARSSVREARKRRQEQRHLERKKHQETVLQRVDDLLDTSEPADEADRDLGRIRAIDGPMTSRHDERKVPAPRADLPRPQHPDVERTPRRGEPLPSIEFSVTPPTFKDQNVQPPPKQQQAREPERTAKHAEPEANAPATAGPGHGHTEPLPTAAVREAVRKQRKPKADAVEPPQQRAGAKAAPDRSLVVDRSHDPPPAVEARPTTWFTGTGSLVVTDAVAEVAAPFAVDPIDQSRDLQTVRRCCATCRDFKQVGDGRTGWCNNPYAFSERRMVQSNEIACRSSLGIWWLPHDDLWLEYADTTHHGRPTPLLDDKVGAVSADRHGMGSRSS